MEANESRDSPYITTWGLVPPSPTRSVEFDHTSPFDSAFDTNIQGSNPLASPAYPNSPSYNGSYYNSPFSQHSELVDLDFLQDLPSASTAPSAINDYEPSEYDPPNQASSLLMFSTDQDFISPHFSPNSIPSDAQRSRASPFDHPSPASSSPGLDDNKHPGRHSRASSVASNHHSPSPIHQPALDPQPSFHPSPRLDVLSSFGNMSVRTPNWSSQPLPNAHSPHLQTESQQQKPQSPPRLTLPPGMTFGSEQTAVPKINAPKEEDGVMFNIVPATPVGGGDPGVRQHTPFQQTLKTLTQGVPLVSSDADPSSQQYQQSQQPTQQHHSPFGSPHMLPTDLSTGDFLFQDRQPRQSDSWQDPSFMDSSQNHLGSSEPFGLHQQQQSRPLRNIDEQHRQQLQTFSFGGAAGGDPIRRVVSDSLAAPRYHHRQSRSEEIRPIPTSTNSGYHGQSNSIGGTGPHFLFPPSSHSDFIQRQQQGGQYLHPNDLPSTSTASLQPQGLRTLSPGMGHIRRASSGSRSGRGAEVWGTQADQQLSMHSNTLGIRRMSPYPTPNASPRVNYSELEELNELGLGNGVGGLGGGGGLGLGLGVGVSSIGVDGIHGIGEPPVSAGYSEEVSITGRGAYARDNGSSQGMESVTSMNAVDGGGGIVSGPVTKQNVTTGRTANASIKRRKQEANFECPVPGCGSTFTRGFNLKGHMRSHYEQKPYKCHWPGCDKGFARQHDCKRHEQLHSNYRPFLCDGCGKNFARMDALNRHLRSEAGAECAKVAEEKKEGGGEMEDDDGEEEEEKKPKILLDSPPPLPPPPPPPQQQQQSTIRRRSESNGNGMLGLPDDMWGVAV